MHQELPSDAEVERWLTTLGVESLCQWDLLVFLYRHPTSLVGADYLARLLGYAPGPVVAALDALESLGLVARSRVSQNVRLYQFTVPAEPPGGKAFEYLRELTEHRAGRLVLAKLLRQVEGTPQDCLTTVARLLRDVGPGTGVGIPPSGECEERSTRWLKAI